MESPGDAVAEGGGGTPKTVDRHRPGGEAIVRGDAQEEGRNNNNVEVRRGCQKDEGGRKESRPIIASAAHDPSTPHGLETGDCGADQASSSSSTKKRDPLADNYRDIVAVINRASDSFRGGEKWRCTGEEDGQAKTSRSSSQTEHRSSRRRSKRRSRRSSARSMTQMATAEESAPMMQAESNKENGGGADARGLNRARGRKLVRQKATNNDEGGGGSALLSPPPSHSGLVEVVDETAALLERKKDQHLRVRGGMPARQWTVDACTGLKTPMQEAAAAAAAQANSGTAYLLRPISRTSILSANSQAADGGGGGGPNSLGERRPSPSDRSRSPLPRSPVRERIRLGEMTTRSAASSFNRSMDASVSSGDNLGAGGGSSRALTAAERKDKRIYERALLPHLQAGNQNRRRLLKQRTSESAPYHGTMTQAGSAYQLPRQYSNASSTATGGAASGGTTGAPHTGGLTTSFSHQGITLVRGASCSLVDIPTYLGPSVAATGGVEVVDLGRAGIVTAPSPAAAAAVGGAVAMAASRQASERRRKQGSISSGSGRRYAPRQRQQIDLTKKKHSTASSAPNSGRGNSNGAGAGGSSGGGGGGVEDGGEKGSHVRKTQWTVLCVSVTLLTLSVALVGGMLSVGSHYQEMVIARRWNELNRRNQSDMGGLGGGGGGVSLLEPFVIVPIDSGEEEEDLIGGSSNSTAEAAEDEVLSDGSGGDSDVHLPIIFPELIKDSEEIRRLSELAKRSRKANGDRRLRES